MTEERVSQWLDSHEDFVTSYFSKKAMKMLHVSGARKRRVSLPRIVCPNVTDHVNGDGGGGVAEVLEIVGSRPPWMAHASSSSVDLHRANTVSTPGSSRKTSVQDTLSECGTPPPDRLADFDVRPEHRFTHSMSTSSVPASRKISGMSGISDTHNTPKLLHSGWSTSSTPTRRLSTMSTPEFDSPLNPIVNEIGGAPSFLRKTSYIPARTSVRQRKSKSELRQLKSLNEVICFLTHFNEILENLFFPRWQCKGKYIF